MFQRNFLLYDELKIKVIDRRGYFSRNFSLFEKDYEYFETEKKFEQYDLIIDLGAFSKPKEGLVVENDKFLCSETFIYSEKKYKVAKFSFQINFLPDGSMYVNIDPNFFANRVIHQLLIDFLVNIKLNQKNFSNMHTAAITKNEKGILISGPGGAGKTSFTLSSISQGCEILGDDRIYIKNGFVYEFPECLGISSGNYKYIYPYIRLKTKLLIQLNNFLRILSLNYVGMPISFSYRELFDKKFLGKKTLLTTIIIIQLSDHFEIEKSNKKLLSHYLTKNQQYEDRFIYDMIMNYSFLYPNNPLIEYVKNYHAKLLANLPENFDTYLIHYPDGKYDQISNWLKEKIWV